MTESDDRERRKHQRVAASLACTMRGEDGAESPFDLVDLPESGIRLRCAESVTAMTRIQVAVLLPAGRIGRDEDVRLDTQGVVVWSHQVQPGEFDTGVFFPELDDDQRGMLQAFVLSAGD